MELLANFQDASRFIEAQLTGFEAKAREVLEREIEELKYDIGRRFQGTAESDFAWHLKIEHEGDSITLYLPYDIGADSKGKKKVSARKKHNPLWTEFTCQPFQEALRDRGYTDIDPSPGQSIPSSGRTAPNVRISAKLPDRLIREITGIL